MFRQHTAPPFVPSDPNSPAWLLKIERKKFLGEWRSEQIKRTKLLKKGLPVPPMPDKFKVRQTAQNAEITGYPQIGLDTSALLHRCNFKTVGIGQFEDPIGDDDFMEIEQSPHSLLERQFTLCKRLKTDVNNLRIRPAMSFSRIGKGIEHYIKNPNQLNMMKEIKFYVAASNIVKSGVGLFTATDIPPKTLVAEYFGHVRKIEVRQFQRIDPLETPYGHIDDGVLMYPDLVNKQYFAIFTPANQEITCAAYFVNYNKEPNLELHRAYTTGQLGSDYGVRKNLKVTGNFERPRFFLFSKDQTIPRHTELCWNYGITDDAEISRQNFGYVSTNALSASRKSIDLYDELYEGDNKKYVKTNFEWVSRHCNES